MCKFLIYKIPPLYSNTFKFSKLQSFNISEFQTCIFQNVKFSVCSSSCAEPESKLRVSGVGDLSNNPTKHEHYVLYINPSKLDLTSATWSRRVLPQFWKSLLLICSRKTTRNTPKSCFYNFRVPPPGFLQEFSIPRIEPL